MQLHASLHAGLRTLMQGLELPQRVFPCRTPAEVRASLPSDEDVVAFQCRNPIHRAHYELFTRALEASNVSRGGVVLRAISRQSAS